MQAGSWASPTHPLGCASCRARSISRRKDRANIVLHRAAGSTLMRPVMIAATWALTTFPPCPCSEQHQLMDSGHGMMRSWEAVVQAKCYPGRCKTWVFRCGSISNTYPCPLVGWMADIAMHWGNKWLRGCKKNGSKLVCPEVWENICKIFQVPVICRWFEVSELQTYCWMLSKLRWFEKAEERGGGDPDWVCKPPPAARR